MWVKYLSSMKQEELFTLALGLQAPWFVDRVEFINAGEREVLHLYVDYKRGIELAGLDGGKYKAYDHRERTWRHLNFFQHECYLHANVPRVKQADGTIQQVHVPWAAEGSSFTLLFEGYALALCKYGLSLSATGAMLGVDGRVIGRIIRRYVTEALHAQPLAQVKVMGIDETSSRKGHNYLTILTDMDRKKVVGIGEGKDEEAFLQAIEQATLRGVSAQHVETVVMDLSPSYRAAAREHLPHADIVFDRFHLEQMISKAVDEVRKQEAQHTVELKKTKYLWLRNGSSLTAKQRLEVKFLCYTYPTLGKAYRFKEWFKQIANNNEPVEATALLKEWIKLANRSKIEPIKKVAKSFKAHWTGILHYFNTRITSAFVERVNLKIQEIKRLAKGYRNIKNFITMIYFHLGNLDLPTHIKR
jgi:transposase